MQATAAASAQRLRELALALPLAGLWIGDRRALISLNAVLTVFMRLDFLLVLTAAGILVWWLTSRHR